ncbi:MAG: hypothetical protein F6K56_28490, partial [Moorea sp. SIO3G5]|nr:hypothetical protein [Moorena sp. SIO3G5]
MKDRVKKVPVWWAVADDSFTAASQFHATATAHPTLLLPIPDSRFPTPDSQLPTPDSRFPTPDSRLPIPDSRLPTPDSRFPKPVTTTDSPQIIYQWLENFDAAASLEYDDYTCPSIASHWQGASPLGELPLNPAVPLEGW